MYSVSNQQDENELEDLSDNSTTQNKIDEIKQRRKQELNKIRCKRYRERKKEIINAQVYKGPIRIVKEEELLKRRREYNKQKSKRYRDRRKLKMLSDGGKRKGQDLFNDDSQEKIAEKMSYQGKTSCQQYTEENIEMFPSQVYKGPIHTIKEENLIDSHKEENRQCSDWYTDNRKLRMYLEAGQNNGQDNGEGAGFFQDGTSGNEIFEVKIEKGSPK